jgi:hypothetical protein
VQQLYQKSLITMHNQRVIIAERALFMCSLEIEKFKRIA